MMSGDVVQPTEGNGLKVKNEEEPLPLDLSDPDRAQKQTELNKRLSNPQKIDHERQFSHEDQNPDKLVLSIPYIWQSRFSPTRDDESDSDQQMDQLSGEESESQMDEPRHIKLPIEFPNPDFTRPAEVKPFECGICGKAFKKVGWLTDHMWTHSNDTPYVCEICEKPVNSKKALRNHMKLHSGDKPFKCDICGKTFRTAGNVQSHVWTHSDDTPFKCHVCGKSVNSKGSLKRHSKIHTNDRQFKCDICGKAFLRSTQLQTHVRIHTGEKPFNCDVCHKAFSHSSDMIRHKRTHSDDKPYKCDLCEKSYTTNSSLVTHKRSHTGEKPYTCKVCHKTYNRTNSLNKHFMRKHTTNKGIGNECDCCGKTFGRIQDLRVHKDTYHPVEYIGDRDPSDESYSDTDVLPVIGNVGNKRKGSSEKEKTVNLRNIRKRNSDENISASPNSVNKKNKFKPGGGAYNNNMQVQPILSDDESQDNKTKDKLPSTPKLTSPIKEKEQGDRYDLSHNNSVETCVSANRFDTLSKQKSNDSDSFSNEGKFGKIKKMLLFRSNSGNNVYTIRESPDSASDDENVSSDSESDSNNTEVYDENEYTCDYTHGKSR
ncbi:zinc finger protein 436 [Patella vulgata]|uniref:zinc finger protein 436 n=1 Tax=Patella vulgata TaxID=6465 RepID=UPI00217FAB1F|nr:zinc finger protein 436 [Patella vulgata]